MKISEWMAKRISYLCHEREISINQLAMDSGLTQSTLNSIMHHESKNPTVVTLLRICRGLNITLSEFFANIEQILKMKNLKRFREIRKINSQEL